jgi:hypothetical protein
MGATDSAGHRRVRAGRTPEDFRVVQANQENNRVFQNKFEEIRGSQMISEADDDPGRSEMFSEIPGEFRRNREDIGDRK